MGVRYVWQGERNPGQKGWQEWFPGKQGLPPRDLTDEDVAALNDTQRGLLASAAGQRLYLVVEPNTETNTGTKARQPKAAKPGVATQGGGEAGPEAVPGEDLINGDE